MLAVRGAMQARRGRAELAWRRAHECVLAGFARPSGARAEPLRLCANSLRQAAELALELPERGSKQLEFDAALRELGAGLESGDEPRVPPALDRAARAADALGWRPANGVR